MIALRVLMMIVLRVVMTAQRVLMMIVLRVVMTAQRVLMMIVLRVSSMTALRVLMMIVLRVVMIVQRVVLMIVLRASSTIVLRVVMTVQRAHMTTAHSVRRAHQSVQISHVMEQLLVRLLQVAVQQRAVRQSARARQQVPARVAN